MISKQVQAIEMPAFVEEFLAKVGLVDEKWKQSQYPSYHTQKMMIGNGGVPCNSKISLKFKGFCKEMSPNSSNEVCVHLKFKVLQTLNEQEIDIKYKEFQKLVRQIVIVSSALNNECNAFFKQYKLECIRQFKTKKSILNPNNEQEIKETYFIVIVKLTEADQSFWIMLQEMLKQYISNISRQELIFLHWKSCCSLADICAIPDRNINSVTQLLLQNSAIEMHSLILKLVQTLSSQSTNQEDDNNNGTTYQNTQTDKIVEQQSNDISTLLQLLEQSELEITLDSFTHAEIEQFGISPIPLSPILLPFQPNILLKIKQFIKEVFAGLLKIQLVNSEMLISLQFEAFDSLHLLFDIFFQMQ